MGESENATAVLLPPSPEHALAFLELASAVASRPLNAERGRVLAFHPLPAPDATWHETLHQLTGPPGIELRAEARSCDDVFATLRGEHAELLVLDWGDWTVGQDDVRYYQL